jgi:peptidoglycan hydrolase FlgJ
LMVRSPRYSAVVRDGQTVAGFTQGLQKAGYATDPDYAAKLSKVINQTLTLKRSVKVADMPGKAGTTG